MDPQLHSDEYIIAVSHKGFCGSVHHYNVADAYGASLIYHCGKGKDSYYLSIPEGGDGLAKNYKELKGQWEKLIEAFLIRHPECAIEE